MKSKTRTKAPLEFVFANLLNMEKTHHSQKSVIAEKEN